MDAPLLALTRRRLAAGPGHADFAADTENMRQLIQLRWVAVVGQLVTILVVGFGLGVPLPLAPMIAALVAAALLNLASLPILRRRGVTRAELLPALLFDVGLLTFQLYLSGGATNPFVSLYLLQVVLGAILLDAWATWIIVGVTSLCFALLTARFVPLRLPHDLIADAGGLYTLGTWLCFALVGTLLVAFVTRITRNLRIRDARLAGLRQQAAEEDHLVRMGLFASGAAHELGTPLATLSVILGDWQRMPRLARSPALVEEIGEMQAEVQRCKTIVTGILHSVGELPGSRPEQVAAGRFVAEVAADWRALHPATALVTLDHLPADASIVADPSLRQAVWNLLDNAAEASPQRIDLVTTKAEDRMLLSVRDRGPGFSPESLAEVGKPQRSVKGVGHGVGLFLVASVLRKLGGTLAAANCADGGAEVRIALPLASPGLRTGTGRIAT